MGLIVLLALQAAAAPTPAPVRIAPVDFDLAEAERFDISKIKLLPDDWENCGATEGDEIVVCARRNPKRYMVGPLPPNSPTMMDEIGDALSFSLGPLQIGSIKGADGKRGFGIGLKF